LESSLLLNIVSIALIGGPILAWVIHVEKKLSVLCSTMQHIYNILERRSSAVRPDDNASI
jgi:hypothetical protein